MDRKIESILGHTDEGEQFRMNVSFAKAVKTFVVFEFVETLDEFRYPKNKDGRSTHATLEQRTNDKMDAMPMKENSHPPFLRRVSEPLHTKRVQ